jgi:hypothetical protein
VYDPVNGGVEYPRDGQTLLLYRFNNGNLQDQNLLEEVSEATGNHNRYKLSKTANVTFAKASWMKNPDPVNDRVARFQDAGDQLSATGGQYRVTDAISTGTRFFRLRK